MMKEYIYFIKPVGQLGPVKIGTSWKPFDRLSQVMVWSPIPLEVELVIEGGEELERNIQDCFADCHSHSEWFFPHERLRVAIDRMKGGELVHDVVDLGKRRGNVRGLTKAATVKRNEAMRAKEHA
jgi:hypothetical protein